MNKFFLLAFTLIFFVNISFSQDLSELYEKVLPSVVKILTAENTTNFRTGQVATEEGLGSGVLVDSEGLVLTASHVVQTASKIAVQFHDGEMIPAEVISSVPSADVALVRLIYKPKDKPAAQIGDSEKVKIGQQIMMVGAPYGLEFSLSVGYISGRHLQQKFTNGEPWVEFLQTDASINKGNSGGPMFNLQGEVVGIASYILSESGGFQGLGFAATSNVCKSLLLEGKSPWTGVEAIFLTEEAAAVLNMPQKAGLLIQKVAELSPSDMLGLKGGTHPATIDGTDLLLGGDIVLAVNGIKIDSQQNMERIQLSMQENDEIVVKIFRAGEVMQLTGKMK